MPTRRCFRGSNSLKQPGTGVSCCSISDCRPVQYRLATDGYEALLRFGWVHVPQEKVLQHQPNPLGRAVLCRSPARRHDLLLCAGSGDLTRSGSGGDAARAVKSRP